MKKNTIRGLCHQASLPLPFLGNRSLAGKLRVIGSRVLGRLKPINFLMLFLKDNRVKRYKKATEHKE